MALTPSPPTPQRGDRTTFSSRVDAFLNWLSNTLVPELNAYQVNLNKIAFGGAYAIPYGVTFIAAARKKLAFSDPSVVLTTNLYLGREDATGLNITTLLDTFDDSTSTIKGYFRVVKQSDASRWAIYAITSVTTTADYYNFTVVHQASTGSTAFAEGDSVILDFQRTGDMGPMGTYPITLLRDVRANGVQAQTMGVGWNRRVLNTLAYNGITGALLNNYAPNTFSLPAGTYLIEASASAYGTQGHMLRLVNATNGAVVDTGTSELSSTAGNNPTIVTKALLRSVVTVTGSGLALAIDHFSNQSGGSGGYPAGSASGATEMYAEIKITKIAS